MSRRIQIPRLAIPVMLLMFYGEIAVAHGPSPELGVLIVMAGKRACDQTVPGFADRFDEKYSAWEKLNAGVISRARQGKYSGKSFDEYLEESISTMLAGPDVEISKTCKDLPGWLDSKLE